MKKVNKCDKNYVGKKQPNFYAGKDKVKSTFFTNKQMILLMYKETYFNINDIDHVVPSVVIYLL